MELLYISCANVTFDVIISAVPCLSLVSVLKGLHILANLNEPHQLWIFNELSVGLTYFDMYVLYIRHRVGQYHSEIIYPILNDDVLNLETSRSRGQVQFLGF